MTGKFVMIGGLDGVGKGTANQAIMDFEKIRGRKIFDANVWWGTDLTREPLHDYNPREEDFRDHDVITTSEPTYAGVGRRIRNEYIKKNGRNYDPRLIANAYALDRYELYTTTIIPARRSGLDIVQSRGIESSLTYQLLDIQERGDGGSVIDYILSLPGNRLAMTRANAPSLLLIPTVLEIDLLAKRLEARNEKDDDAIFENVAFQRKLKPLYESDWFRELFEDIGTEVRFIDAGVSIEHTKEQAVMVWKEHLGIQ